MTDAENQTTAYTYDVLNRRLTIQSPDHVAGTNPGDQHYGIQATAYDAAGRARRKTDQRGDTISLIYDLAGRMLRREYRTHKASLSTCVPKQSQGTSKMSEGCRWRFRQWLRASYATIAERCLNPLF